MLVFAHGHGEVSSATYQFSGGSLLKNVFTPFEHTVI